MRIPTTASVVVISMLWVSPGQAQETLNNEQKIFTTDADFALGSFEGTKSQAPDSNQLRIDAGARAPFLWVAGASNGSVTKVDTRTGRLVARYDSVLTQNWDGSVPPVRPPRDACNNAVPTAVDAQGDVFVLNRSNCGGVYASVSKYAGSLAACVDRNGNGVINTSSDVNGDGSISLGDPAEFLGQLDECILWTRTFTAAVEQGRALVVDAGQNVWVSTLASKLYQLSGQSGEVLKTIDVGAETGVASVIQALAIGPGGFLYASDSSAQRRVRKINPNGSVGSHVVDSLSTPVSTFGITVARDGVVWLGAESDSASGVVRVDFAARTAQMVGGGGGCVGRTRGITVDATGDVWAACWGANRLLRVSSTGAYLNSPVVSSPEGVAVAPDRKIWVTSSSSEALTVFNPASLGSPPQTFTLGSQSFTASDMTGFNHHQFVQRQGTWRVVHDSGRLQAHWGTLLWNQEPQGATPAGTSITVRARAADTQAALSSRPFNTMTNGQHVSGIDGRFIEVEVKLASSNFSGEPVLSDLTIAPYNTAPEALCADRNVCAAPSTCNAPVSVDNGSYDPDGDFITRVQSPAGPYAIGSRSVGLTVSDATLNDSCSANVRVRDCEPPSIACAAPVQAECTGNGAANVSLGGAQATDSCSAVSVTGPGTGSYPLGTTSLSYTAADSEGNTAVCTTSVKVVDTQAPTHVLNGAASQALECGSSYVEQGSTATDVCANVTGSVVITGTVNPLAPGSYERRYSVADPSGNSGPVLTRAVTVSDTQAPVLVLRGDASQALECGASYVEQGYTVQDACAASTALSVAVTGTVDPLVPGTYARHYSAADPSGNSSPGLTRTVTVSDTQAPVLSLLGDTSSTVECGSSFNEPGYQANDVCAGDVSGRVARTGSVNTAVPGAYPVSYRVADPSGNSSAALVRTVTVADTHGPTVVLNGAATLAHECGAAFNDPLATATDACVGNVSSRLTIAGSVNVGQPGPYVLTYGATDTSGNAATPVSRTVNVSDTQAPALALNGANPLLLECKQGGYVEPGATATDACSGVLPGGAIVIEQPAIDPAVLASHSVTYRATDSAGNVATAVRQVSVRDTLPPVVTLNGPDTVLLECKVDAYTEQGATASDVCSGSLPVTITGTVDLNVFGAQPVRYRAQDANGLVTEKVRDVRVVDSQPPTLTLGADPTEPVECSRGAFIDLGASAIDFCNGDITDRITISGTQQIIAPGTYPITFGVTDLAGNAAPSITRNVTVKDTQAPVITMRGEAFLDLECGVDTYTELGATADDACQGDMTSALQTYGNGANTAAVGTYSIEYGVWDATGNTRKALRTVKVSDRLPPTLTLVGPAVMQHECASGIFEDPYATASDACFGNLTSSIQRQGFVNAWTLGTYALTYNVQDSALHSAPSVTRSVHVVDTQGPTFEYRQLAATPADQTMRGFSLSDCVTANDSCDGWANVNNGTILSIYSDEPEDAPDSSDGSTAQDIVITGRNTFQLRAERQEGGNGRVYGVRFSLKDLSGNSRVGLCRISVPGAEVSVAQDNGEAAGYTVTAPPSTVASLGAP
jgi:streptogramin lyase